MPPESPTRSTSMPARSTRRANAASYAVIIVMRLPSRFMATRSGTVSFFGGTAVAPPYAESVGRSSFSLIFEPPSRPTCVGSGVCRDANAGVVRRLQPLLHMRFRDRHDAGRKLADRLAHHRGEDVVVIGMARGGVVVAYAGIPKEVVERVASLEHGSMENDLCRYRGGLPAERIAGRTAILVDDGLATGTSAVAAIRSS